MHHALRLAARGLGHTWPNPSVGAVVVKDNVIFGAAATARGGRPHAEPQALIQAGEQAKGATLYVTLEPCAHHGKTPPCTESIIAAGIARVVIACGDIHPQVAGRGIAALQAAGIEVTQGICEPEARRINEGFFSVTERGRPFVTLKLATSLDGKIAQADGTSKWITGEPARAFGHYIRASHDAILTGIGTVLADDPLLTCRLAGREADSPQRVVLDSRLRIPQEAKILPAWIFTASSDAEKKEWLEKKGSRIFTASRSAQGIVLEDMLHELAGQGITRLIVEAGSKLASAFMQTGLVDRLYWFRAPVVIGDSGIPALIGHNTPLSALERYCLQETRRLGEDVLEVYEQPMQHATKST